MVQDQVGGGQDDNREGDQAGLLDHGADRLAHLVARCGPLVDWKIRLKLKDLFSCNKARAGLEPVAAET